MKYSFVRRVVKHTFPLSDLFDVFIGCDSSSYEFPVVWKKHDREEHRYDTSNKKWNWDWTSLKPFLSLPSKRLVLLHLYTAQYDLSEGNSHYIVAVQMGCDYVEEKSKEVSLTDADPQERTMMIEPLNTYVTFFTVHASGRPHNIARPAVFHHHRVAS